MKILVLEDNVEINKIITDLFTDEGYDVLSYNNAFDALNGFENNSIQCVLTDLMLPIMSGEEFIKKIRPDYYGLIIAITAKTKEEDKLKVLEFGADDYILKPFNKREVLLKVNNYFKKLNKNNHKTSLNNGDLIFNHHDNTLIVNKEVVTLTSLEYLTFDSLIGSINKIITRQSILDKVYFNEVEVFDRVIDGHIKNVRKKIKQYSNQEYIKTVYGLGYKLVGEVDE